MLDALEGLAVDFISGMEYGIVNYSIGGLVKRGLALFLRGACAFFKGGLRPCTSGRPSAFWYLCSRHEASLKTLAEGVGFVPYKNYFGGHGCNQFEPHPL